MSVKKTFACFLLCVTAVLSAATTSDFDQKLERARKGRTVQDVSQEEIDRFVCDVLIPSAGKDPRVTSFLIILLLKNKVDPFSCVIKARGESPEAKSLDVGILAYYYYFTKDYEKAIATYLTVINRWGGRVYMRNLAKMYDLTKNQQEALRWYRQAAEKGDKFAIKKVEEYDAPLKEIEESFEVLSIDPEVCDIYSDILAEREDLDS